MANINEVVVITTQKEAGISDETVYAFWQQSFRQWTDHGIDELSLHQTLEFYKKSVKNAIIFVAVGNKSGELLGTHTLQPNRRKKCIHGCYLAVSPKAKRKGIATMMLQHEIEYLSKAGYEYIYGKTSSAAYWSVKWHLKNGYRIIGYSKSPEISHSNYIFRKQLKPSLIWSGPIAPLAAGGHFIASYTITCLCKTNKGELNILGRVAKEIVRIIHQRAKTK